MNEEQLQLLLVAIGEDGRLVFMPSDNTYRAVHSATEIQASDVSALLKGGYVEKAGTMAGVYKLTANGRATLAGGESDG